LPHHKQDGNRKFPAPRIGCRMVKVDSKTLFLHNGHDNDNEKLGDLWSFDLVTNTWRQVD